MACQGSLAQNYFLASEANARDTHSEPQIRLPRHITNSNKWLQNRNEHFVWRVCPAQQLENQLLLQRSKRLICFTNMKIVLLFAFVAAVSCGV